MKILVGLDDSTFSKQAIEYVSRVRWPAGSRILVISVLNGPVDPPDGNGVTRVQARENLVAKAGQRTREAGLSTETRVLEGEPGHALVATAQSERCDLIVVGSRGRSRLAQLLLGSTAHHVVTHAPCSVLVVKGNTKPQPTTAVPEDAAGAVS